MSDFKNGYRGTVGGAVQTAYTDQPGIAVPGMLAFSSDLNNCDALLIAEMLGIAAGKGVKFAAIDDDISLQRPNLAASLPAVADDADDFAGILAFDEHMQSDENGVPGYAKGRVGRFLRPGRAGGRIYVKAVVAIDPATSTVNWVTVAGTDELYEVGEFAPAALAGDATEGTSVVLSNARWVTKAAAGDVAILELI